ncbi:MAG: hypothetical protein HC833_03375 [Leptolyngbyaceae cyanobacterium RM1_406_9]|nr:hypothetical protein [Leptolyngbyaceae cyanobacterium RM1_406_9]
MNSFGQIRVGVIKSTVVLVSSIGVGLGQVASAEDLTVASFNVESGGADPVVIATEQMAP